MPLAVSLQGFDNQLYLFSFNQSEIGFLLNSGYPLADLGLRKLGPFSLEHITAGLGYHFESVGISGLSPFTTFDIRTPRATAESRSSCPRSAASRSTTRGTRAAVRSRASTWSSPGWAAHSVRQGRAARPLVLLRSSRVRGLANGFTRPRSRLRLSVPRWNRQWRRIAAVRALLSGRSQRSGPGARL